MWPLVAWLLLYPLALRLSDWLVRLAGREVGAGNPRLDLALYLVVALYLATAPLLP